MTNLKFSLSQLHRNLQILREREAKYAGNAPVELINQIADHRQAIELTEQAIVGELTEAAWREQLRPLLVNIRERGETLVDCRVEIGDVVIGDQVQQHAEGSNIAQATHGGTATVNVSTFDQRGQQVETQYNADGDINIDQTAPESSAWRVWTVFLGIVTIIGVIIALFTVPQFNSWVFPEPTITPTPFPSPTPLAFAPAAEGESLILIATFHETGATKTEPHVKIKRAIQDAAAEVGLNTLRVEIEPTILTADQREEAEALGKLYDAEMVIWGEDTGVQVLVNFYNRKQPDFDAADVKISEEQRTQIVNPSAYAEFILRDLPEQMTFLAFFAVGQSYYSRKQYNQAINVIEAGVAALNDKAKPDGLPNAYFRLGWLYQVPLGNTTSAIAGYNKAIELDSNYTYAYNNRGIALADEGDSGAIADYNKAIELDSQDAQAYNNRGIILYRQGDSVAAIVDYTKAIELDPKYADAYYNRGIAFRNQGNLTAAIVNYTKAIELDPRVAAAYNNLGNALTDQDNLAAAITNYNKAIDLNPEFAAAFFNIARVYALQEKVTEALPPLRRALELNREHYLSLASMRDDPAFNLIRNDPRFTALLAEFTIKNDQSIQSATPETKSPQPDCQLHLGRCR